MVMEETPGIRKTFVLNRGSYEAPGEEVKPGTPAAILPFPSNLPANRLGLAQWMTRRDNPLVARVVVNHYWQLIFGRGLVATPEDFGSQGSLPTHPELLDWLAVDFQENHWDLKRLIRTMVLSTTYRLSSKASPQAKEKDPENLWLSHGSRYRKPMEMIRDNALSASGLLVRKIGGESVRPYQPAGLWEETTSGRHLTKYIPHHGDSLYRRSLYTFYKRTSPPPIFNTFDGPERSYCNVRRQKTNTPLQALIGMNDPQLMEAARVLSQRLLAPDPEERPAVLISEMASRILCRTPSAKEKQILESFFSKKEAEYRKDPEKAEKLVSVGEFPVEKSVPRIRMAALAQVGLLLLNTDEALSRE
jgi:hypothetical protein